MQTDPIKIEGLSQFRRNLKNLDNDLPKALRVALNEAVDIVVDDARPRIPSRSGKARRSVRAASTVGAKVRIKGGGRRAPYYPWLDFGGRVGRAKSVRRPFLKEGRYIYRSFFDNRDRVYRALENAIIETARKAGVEVD